MAHDDLFPSFWMAGFDCASQVQCGRLDMTAELQHDRFAGEDYARLAPFGIRAVHDGIRWYLIERRPGRIEPELGGHPRYLDILGFNHYPHSEVDTAGRILPRTDPRWVDLGILLAEVYARYKRPLFISEAGDVGAARPAWIEYVAGQVVWVLEHGLPLQAICLYPAINIPDWDTGECQRYGLWDVEPCPDGTLARVLNEPAAAALRAAQARLQPYEKRGLTARAPRQEGALIH